MPYYSDSPSYHYGGGAISYSPYYTPTTPTFSSFTGYSRALTGGYTAPPIRTTYSPINRIFKPMLTPISESRYSAIPSHRRSQTLTTLTRINSPKINIHHTSPKYTAPKPIQINTADIDVTANRYKSTTNHNNNNNNNDNDDVNTNLKNNNIINNNNKNNESGNRINLDEKILENKKPNENDNINSPYMPRIDQNDPPNSRATIKRDRNVVRLSTVHSRRRSRSKSKSIKSGNTVDEPSSSYDSENSVEQMKSSWRDRFGEDLVSKPKIIRKTPGELILEKHIIKDKRHGRHAGDHSNKSSTSTAQQSQVQTVIQSPSPSSSSSSIASMGGLSADAPPKTQIIQEVIYLEPRARKSIRRHSLVKCPSFKDICKEISSDIKENDDLNACDLRRKASIILEEEILNHFVGGPHQKRKVSSTTNDDNNNAEGIINNEEEGAGGDDDNTNNNNKSEVINENDVEKMVKNADDAINDSEMKINEKSNRKSKLKNTKSKPKIIATVEIDEVDKVDDFVEAQKPANKWNLVVEDIEEDHTTIHKIFKLPKKRNKSVDNEIKLNVVAEPPPPQPTQEKPQTSNIKKSESIDFWSEIGPRESIYYDKRKRNLLMAQNHVEKIVNENIENEFKENDNINVEQNKSNEIILKNKLLKENTDQLKFQFPTLDNTTDLNRKVPIKKSISNTNLPTSNEIKSIGKQPIDIKKSISNTNVPKVDNETKLNIKPSVDKTNAIAKHQSIDNKINLKSPTNEIDVQPKLNEKKTVVETKSITEPTTLEQSNKKLTTTKIIPKPLKIENKIVNSDPKIIKTTTDISKDKCALKFDVQKEDTKSINSVESIITAAKKSPKSICDKKEINNSTTANDDTDVKTNNNNNNNKENVEKKSACENTKNVSIDTTSLKITTGIEAKSPEIKQMNKQTKVKDISVLKKNINSTNDNKSKNLKNKEIKNDDSSDNNNNNNSSSNNNSNNGSNKSNSNKNNKDNVLKNNNKDLNDIMNTNNNTNEIQTNALVKNDENNSQEVNNLQLQIKTNLSSSSSSHTIINHESANATNAALEINKNKNNNNAVGANKNTIKNNNTDETTIKQQQLNIVNKENVDENQSSPPADVKFDNHNNTNHNNNNNNNKNTINEINNSEQNSTVDSTPSSNLTKFSTVNNLNNLTLNDKQRNSHKKESKKSSCRKEYHDDDFISGDESDLPSVISNSIRSSSGDSDQFSDDEMGLKRRHKKKKDKNFDPKKVIKLDHSRKCYVIDESPKYPLIATPRPLQKRFHYFSESETDESESNSDSDSDDSSNDSYDECLSPNVEGGPVKDVRMSTCSNDSGFEGGTAPASPKKMLDCDVNCHKKCEKLTANLCGVNQKLIVEALSSVRRGVREARDSPSTPPSHNPAFKIDSNHDDDLETSYTFAQFQRSGRITAPATTIPRFKKYAVDDFHFLTVLGKGSFGKVLLAELRNTEYYYAVKCLKKDVVLEDDDVECTLIERKVLALGTKHPYLCHLFCTFQTESHLFFVMEYLNGGDLMFHIQVSGRFPEPRAKFYAAEIISGLKFLHKKGIIYRDLKLDNVLLDFDGHVRIADFGMCKLQIYLDRTADSFCGTPDYMAPEVIKGQNYNQAVDWWSFGVLLYEMLIGQSPFSGCDEDELFWSICNEIPWYPFYLSKDALNILSKLFEKDATLRLGSINSPHGEITDNVFFHEIEWKKLERRALEPPFRPQVKHPLDTQYFDRAFTRERVRLTPIDKEILQSMDQHQFQGFTYTNPNATLN